MLMWRLSHDWINTSLYAPASEIIRCAKYPCQTPTLETTSTHFCSTWIYDTRIAQTWIFAFAVQKDDEAKNILSEDCLRVEWASFVEWQHHVPEQSETVLYLDKTFTCSKH